MKPLFVICRLLLGLIFFVFGLNGFLHFIPMGPMPAGLAGQFFVVMTQSHYMVPVFALQLICGILLLINQFVPLALAILAPIIVNILIFHITMQPAGLPPGMVALILWTVLASRLWSHFAPLLSQKTSAG
jgi:putative oxidoreductase